jgi:spore germination protein GerM
MIFRGLIIAFLVLVVSGCSVPSKVVKIYYFQDEKLVSVDRELPTIENPVMIAIDQLLIGPNEQEAAKNIITRIPQGTRSRKVDVEGDLAIVDLNSRFADFEGTTAEAKAMVSQVVYTATNVRGIKKVLLKLAGNDQFSLGPGYIIDHPLERGDVKN